MKSSLIINGFFVVIHFILSVPTELTYLSKIYSMLNTIVLKKNSDKDYIYYEEEKRNMYFY